MDNREWEEGASEPSFHSQQSMEQSKEISLHSVLLF